MCMSRKGRKIKDAKTAKVYLDAFFVGMSFVSKNFTFNDIGPLRLSW